MTDFTELTEELDRFASEVFAAIREARTEAKRLAAENERLRAEIADLKARAILEQR